MPPTPPRSWSYGRAFFLTLGLGVLGLMTVVLIAQGDKSENWPVAAWILFIGMILAGLLSCCFSILARDRLIRKWFDSSGGHEGEVVIAIVAAPVYRIGRLLGKPRRKR